MSSDLTGGITPIFKVPLPQGKVPLNGFGWMNLYDF